MRLRFIPLATSFRSAYGYDHVRHLVAGEVIEAVRGMSWEPYRPPTRLCADRHDDS